MMRCTSQYILSFNTCPTCRNVRPLTTGFFAIEPTSAAVAVHQTTYFYNLFSWLAAQCGQAYSPPSELDDPNKSASLAAEVLRSLNIPVPPGVGATDWVVIAPKLKQGWGSVALAALTGLADCAIKMSGHVFQRPNFPKDELRYQNFLPDFQNEIQQVSLIYSRVAIHSLRI
jgi:estrogen-related receptor beta like 1